MRWDVVVFGPDIPLAGKGGRAIFHDGWHPKSMGSRSQVAQALSEIWPQIDWSDPTWGILDGSGYCLEIALGRDDTVLTFTIFARGHATEPILDMLNGTGWRGLDTATGNWMHLTADADEGRRRFQGFLEKNVPLRGRS